jgi:geranyl-CoA carboxylase alpha subunit
VRLWQPPRGVRCDHALASGTEIGPFYDALLAKVAAQAPTRAAAVQRLADALDRTVCLGVATNRAFLARVLRHPAFGEDAVSTAFLAQHFPDDETRANPAPSWLRALAAASQALLAPATLPALWAGWTSSGRVETTQPIDAGAGVETWHLSGTPDDVLAQGSGSSHRLAGLERESRSTVRARVDGRPVRARCLQDDDTSWWLCDGIDCTVRDLRWTPAPAVGGATVGALRAPMHGRITEVHARAGAAVQAGALLLVMEAMKMEHRIHAPFAGTVSALHTRVDEQVFARQVLIEIDA